MSSQKFVHRSQTMFQSILLAFFYLHHVTSNSLSSSQTSVINQHYNSLETAIQYLNQRIDLSIDQKKKATDQLLDAHVQHATNSILLQQQQQQKKHRHLPPTAEHIQQNHPKRKLLMAEDDIGEDEMGLALTEPTPECKRVLNVWTAKCVFGP